MDHIDVIRKDLNTSARFYITDKEGNIKRVYNSYEVANGSQQEDEMLYFPALMRQDNKRTLTFIHNIK